MRRWSRSRRLPSVNEPARNGAAAAEPESSDADAVEYVQPQPVAQTESLPPRAVAPARAALSLSKIILLLYLAVAGVFLIRLAWGLIAALGLWHRATPITGELLTVSASVDLRCSSEVSSPVTICSAIVLPADYATWDSEKLRVVLAHERSHIRQRDFYLQLLAGVYAAVVWFSPLGWWLKRKLSDLAEAISDRAGLEEAADRASYAQILLEFAAAPRPTLIGVAMARNGSLSRRIERLLNDVSFRQAFAGSSRALAAVLVVPVVLFAVTALVRVQAAGQQAPEPPAPAAAPQRAVAAPPAPVAPAASGVSEPEQISGELAPAAPEDPFPQAVAPAPASAPQRSCAGVSAFSSRRGPDCTGRVPVSFGHDARAIRTTDTSDDAGCAEGTARAGNGRVVGVSAGRCTYEVDDPGARSCQQGSDPYSPGSAENGDRRSAHGHWRWTRIRLEPEHDD